MVETQRKILLVDDSQTSLMWQRMILRKESFELVAASDGEEAVEKAVEERPDLILMDVVMPKKSGFEALREIRARAATEAIPVIMVTTKGTSVDVEEGYRSGCNDYITKPIDGLELVSKVKNLLDETD